MGGALTGFGTPGITPSQSPFGTPWGAGAYGTSAPQQLLQSLQHLLQLEYIQQQQVLQLVPQKLQQLQQLQHLIQLVAQQHASPFQQQASPFQFQQGTLPFPSFAGQGWLTGTPGIQPQIFGGHGGYVM